MPPPQGRPYNYSPANVRRYVPEEAGVYWLRSTDRVTYIGESLNLRRRLQEHKHREPLRFQYNTLSDYCKRYSVSIHPWMDKKRLCYKIENTELSAYRARFGTLPPENKQDNHYEAGFLEDALDRILTVQNEWF